MKDHDETCSQAFRDVLLYNVIKVNLVFVQTPYYKTNRVLKHTTQINFGAPRRYSHLTTYTSCSICSVVHLLSPWLNILAEMINFDLNFDTLLKIHCSSTFLKFI